MWMSTYFSNLTGQQDALQTRCLLNPKLDSYEQSSDLPQNMIYLNAPPLASSSHPELFPGAASMQSREEKLFLAPHQITGQLHFSPGYSESDAVGVDPQILYKKLIHFPNAADHNLQHQGLSLSLGNQLPSYGFSSLFSPNVEHASDDHIPQSSELKTAEYLSFDLSGPSNSSSKVGVYDHHSSICPKEMNSDPKLHQETVISGAIYNSRYLKAAQELLDEVVNVHQALNPPSNKSQDLHSVAHGVSEETNLKSVELSPAQRNDLQNKMTKLLSMLDEVDRRYRQYCQQMKVVVSSFEIVAGSGAGRSYTALARQTISHQFRGLKDEIKSQLQAVQQSLGEEAAASNSVGVGLPRLRLVDQQLRQQRVLMQFGIMRQPWRPQRGLPETAVSVLRAWLFEHFLHPYPKDSEKLMLARHTGLTRGQVANWFINARVRLWKPMIEEMFKEEFADMEAYSKPSPELAQATGRLLKSESEDTGDELHESMMVSADADCGQTMQPKEMRADYSSPELKVDNNAYTARLGFQNNPSFEEDKMDSEIDRSRSEGMVIPTSASNAYNFSLALGLQHPVETTRSGGGVEAAAAAAAAAAVSLDKADYYCLDAINQQDRFSSPHLLSDFVL